MSAKSLMFQTVSGKFIHLSDITELSKSGFGDEEHLVDSLKGESTNDCVIWCRTKTGVYKIDCDCEFNVASAGARSGYYSDTGMYMNTNIGVERYIVSMWEVVLYPDYKNYCGNIVDN